jgi:DinB superfamily
MAAPDPSEYPPSYGKYISLVGGHDIVTALEEQPQETMALLSGLTDEQADFRYAPDKWSIKEMLGHLIDTERIFAYRALRIARNDPKPMAGFEQDDYVRYGGFSASRFSDLLEEFNCVRRSTVFLFQKLTPDAWTRRGVANESEISVRALAYAIAGHELHHRQILKERYLPACAPSE